MAYMVSDLNVMVIHQNAGDLYGMKTEIAVTINHCS